MHQKLYADTCAPVWLAASSSFALDTLHALADQGLLAGVLTTPSKPQGRGLNQRRSDITTAATARGIPMHEVDALHTSEAKHFIESLKPTIILTCSFGRIVPAGLLAIPTFGWFNIHASLLPRYRGAAPIQRSIQAGDTHSGISVFRLDAGLDTGPLVFQKEMERGVADGYSKTHRALAALAAHNIGPVINSILANQAEEMSQTSLPQTPTHAPKVKKSEGEIDWGQPATVVAQTIKAFEQWPKCYTYLHGKRVIVEEADPVAGLPPQQAVGSAMIANNSLTVRCGVNHLAIHALRREGKARCDGLSFYHGNCARPIVFGTQ